MRLRNSLLSQTSLYMDAILASAASCRSLRPSLAATGQHGVVLQVNSVFYEFLLYEITTQLNNTRDLKLTSCEKNLKYALMVDMKITSVDGVHNDLEYPVKCFYLSVRSLPGSLPYHQ